MLRKGYLERLLQLPSDLTDLVLFVCGGLFSSLVNFFFFILIGDNQVSFFGRLLLPIFSGCLLPKTLSSELTNSKNCYK